MEAMEMFISVVMTYIFYIPLLFAVSVLLVSIYGITSLIADKGNRFAIKLVTIFDKVYTFTVITFSVWLLTCAVCMVLLYLGLMDLNLFRQILLFGVLA